MEKGMYMVLIVAAVAVVSLVFLTMNAQITSLPIASTDIIGLAVSASCTDTDDYVNNQGVGDIWKKGTVTARLGNLQDIKTDFCIASGPAKGILNEFFCTPFKTVGIRPVNCNEHSSSGAVCFRGACVSGATPTCLDTDKNEANLFNNGIFEKGTIYSPTNDINGQNPVATDTCVQEGGDFLKEHSCNNQGQHQTEVKSCSNTVASYTGVDEVNTGVTGVPFIDVGDGNKYPASYCTQGRCVSLDEVCIDGDHFGGQDYDPNDGDNGGGYGVKSSIKITYYDLKAKILKNKIYHDECVDNKHIKEYTCSPYDLLGGHHYTIANCKTIYGQVGDYNACVLGRCMNINAVASGGPINPII